MPRSLPVGSASDTMNRRAADVRVKVPLFVTLLLTAGVDATAVPDEAAKTGMMPSGTVPDNDCKYSKNRDDLLFHVLPFLNKNTFPFRRNLSENEISRAIIAHPGKIINIFFRNV